MFCTRGPGWVPALPIDPRCFCRVDDETLEHLFFECELARLLVAWVHFHLWQICPSAAVFSVTELLFGFSSERRRIVPPIIIWMFQVMKHTIWVAPCDFHFHGQVPVASECQKKAIAKIKFVLRLFGRRCRLPAQVRSFEWDWLAPGILGHFEGGGVGLLLLVFFFFFFSLLFREWWSPSLVVLQGSVR